MTSNDWLVAVGFITFVVVAWQAFETRRAAEASADNARAARESANMMKILNRQAMTVDDWRGVMEQPGTGPRMFRATFTVTNTSGRTVTLDRVDWLMQHEADMKGTDYYTPDVSYAPLHPGQQFEVQAYTHLSELEKVALKTHGFRLTLMGYVIFIDVFGDWQRQPFGRFFGVKDGLDGTTSWDMSMFLVAALKRAEKKFVEHDAYHHGLPETDRWGKLGSRWPDHPDADLRDHGQRKA